MTSPKVLIVDDEEPARILIAAILAMHGWEVAQAADGVDALAAALARRFDLIISDVEMPRMTGPALIRALEEASVPVKCLLISGYSQEEIKSAGWETSMRLLQKPFRVDQLLQAIEDVLAGSEQTSEQSGDCPRRPAASQGETAVHRAG